MLGSADEEKIGKLIKTNWSIYFSFVMALVMYVVVAYMVTASAKEPRPAPAMLRGALIGLSIGFVGIKFWLHGRQADESNYGQCRNVDEVLGKYGFYFFISLALAEAPALFGLIVVFLTQNMSEFLVFLVIAGVLHAASTPRGEVLRRMVEAHIERNPQQTSESGA